MKINSIELQNFRQFVNERIEFNSDSDKKVSVIYGRNYIGKTTLIKALLWCLYRDDDSFKADPIHVNKELQDSCFSVGNATCCANDWIIISKKEASFFPSEGGVINAITDWRKLVFDTVLAMRSRYSENR